jgi:hypothetical protein
MSAMSLVPKWRACVAGSRAWNVGGEFAAVVDELADEGEEATDAAFLFRAGWGGIGRRVWGGGGRRG